MGLRLINYTFHNMADEMGMEFHELCKKAEKDKTYDITLDKKQIEMAEQGNCVLGSRLAIWLLENADLKVYLHASPEVRAQRIQEREGGTYEDVLERTLERDKRDRQRYMNLYDIDNNKYQFADLVIDTEKMAPEAISDLIAAEVEKKN